MFELGILINSLFTRYVSNSPLDIIFNKNKFKKGLLLLPLFKPQKNLIISAITSQQLVKCAVDDFDFIHNDFGNEQIPFDWDINNLIELPNPHHHHPHPHQYHHHQITNNNSSPFSPQQQGQFEEYETTLDEELTFIDRSKMFLQQQYLQQQQLQSQQQQLQLQHQQQLQLQHQHQQQLQLQQQQQHMQLQLKQEEDDDEDILRQHTNRAEGRVDLNVVNTIFDDYLLENELSILLNSQILEPELDKKPILESKPGRECLKTKKKPKKAKTPKPPKPTVFHCSYCPANFKVKGYLTRHLKKHSLSKLFICPFYSAPSNSLSSPLSTRSSPSSTESSTTPSSASSSSTTTTATTTSTCPAGTKCHPSGGFSRRDTFKTHLKALHFIYPPGTKSNSRSLVAGRCAGCFQFFNNNSTWLNDHIEKNNCPNMIHKF